MTETHQQLNDQQQYLPNPKLRPAVVESVKNSTVLPLLLVCIVLFYTNRWFSIQEDEALIIGPALRSWQDILGTVLQAHTPHAHPPLSDLLVHAWLVLTGGSFQSLRWLNIGFYLGGLWFLAKASRLIVGPSGAPTLLWLGLLWPYGFHFGWVVGWFTVAFFLVSVLTFEYLKFLESSNIRNWLWMLLAALALVWTHYYGWCIVGLLALDYLLRHGRKTRIFALQYAGTLGLLALGFLPLLADFLRTLGTRTGESGRSVFNQALYGVWNLYVMFASESIGPWHFALSLPVGLAVATILTLTLWWAPQKARRILIGFCLLFGGMLFLGVLGTKRAMLIAPWLLLPVAATAAVVEGKKRAALTTALLIVACVGWFGILSRQYYGTLRFFEPWQEVSEKVAQEVRAGAGVLAYHPIFFFYLTYDLRFPEQGSPWRLTGILPTGVKHPRVFEPVQWMESGHPARGKMIFVKASGFLERQERARPAEDWLEDHCLQEEVRGYLPDPESELKNRFADRDPGFLPYRIEVRKYRCIEIGGP